MQALFSPEQREQLVRQLAASLDGRVMGDLRTMARLWGWTQKGTTKAALIQMLVENLADPKTMAAARASLPPLEHEALHWLSILPGRQGGDRTLSAILTQSTGKDVSQADAAAIIGGLHARGLVQLYAQGGLEVPMLYREWLTGLTPTGMVVDEPAELVPSPSAAVLSLHVDNLASFVTLSAVNLPQAQQGARSAEMPRVGQGDGPVPAEQLRQWGYASLEEQHMARFLLTTLLYGGLLQVTHHKASSQLAVDAEAMAAWQALAPDHQQTQLAQWWLQPDSLSPASGLSSQLLWTEFDLALEFHRQQRSSLKLGINRYYYGGDPLVERAALSFRQTVARTAGLLSADTWLSFDRFCQVLRAISPALVGSQAAGDIVQWIAGDRIVDPRAADTPLWMATYGTQVAAWLTGPAKWLGLVEVAYKDGRLIAFQRPAAPRVTQPAKLPDDALRFLPDGRITLRSIWQAAELRVLVRQIASIEVREGATITYRLDPAAFRVAHHRGVTTAQLAAAFAGFGFPLPAEVHQRVATWESRAGRFQLYDQVAAIELSDDLALREVESAAGLGQHWTYPASSRCLLLLDPASAAEIAAALQRRGYMPKVTS